MTGMRVVRTAGVLMVSGLMLVVVPGVANASAPSQAAGHVATAWSDTKLSPSSCSNTSLRLYSQGECVAVLQITLNLQFRVGLAQDGVYGAKTRAAVIAFQARYGLEQDGIAGPKTWAKVVWCQYQVEHGLPY